MIISHNLNIKLEVQWVSRESGEIEWADAISRDADFWDYRLSAGSFAFISDRVGPFDTDYFASEWSYQLKPFFSLYWSENSAGINAFS